MSVDDVPTTADTPRVSRRQLLVTGGLSVSLAALVAACSDDAAEPGRVGNAPVETALPDEPVDDAVYLRTASSLEYTALDVYAQLDELGVLDPSIAALVGRIVEHHTANAAILAELTTKAGGDAYECANPWFAERVVPELFERLSGTADVAEGATPIEPSDDAGRDALGIAYGIESVLASMYQELVVRLQDPSLRSESIGLGALSARQAAAMAIARGGSAGYVNPTITGGEVDAEESDGVLPIYAVPGNFGTLAPITFTVGPLSDAGTRFTASLQTPANNSFVYASLSCEA
ncbi:MAG: ferritin-like domain-containing protein [Desertimonas sp.]